MTKQQVTCSLVTASNTKQSFVWHGHLGAFESEWHHHPKGQLMYAEKGCIHVDIEGRKLLLPGWYCAWVPAAINHKVWSNHSDVYIRTLYFGSELTTGKAFEQPCVFPASTLLREMIAHTAKWHKLLTHDDEERDFLQALRSILPAEMAKSAPACLPTTIDDKLAPVLDYIQQHLHEKLGLEDMARQFGYSSRALTRAFQHSLGMPFSSYTKIARAMKAMELIGQGASNVSELAYSVGYESVSTFSNNFLAICGKRPLEFMGFLTKTSSSAETPLHPIPQSPR
ncbi:MAG TPA: helix-turn-helix transcriptional regulator [Chryseolinea sp.]